VDDVMFISLTITCDQQRSVVLSDLQQTLVPSVRPTRQLEIRADTKIRSLDGRRSHWSSRRPALFFLARAVTTDWLHKTHWSLAVLR